MPRIKKIDFVVAPIFGIHNKFLDLLFFKLLNKFKIVLLAILQILTTLLLLVLNTFGINSFYKLVFFNINVSNTIILLKFWIKR